MREFSGTNGYCREFSGTKSYCREFSQENKSEEFAVKKSQVSVKILEISKKKTYLLRTFGLSGSLIIWTLSGTFRNSS